MWACTGGLQLLIMLQKKTVYPLMMGLHPIDEGSLDEVGATVDLLGLISDAKTVFGKSIGYIGTAITGYNTVKTGLSNRAYDIERIIERKFKSDIKSNSVDGVKEMYFYAYSIMGRLYDSGDI